jgi:hypothetical protein
MRDLISGLHAANDTRAEATAVDDPDAAVGSEPRGADSAEPILDTQSPDIICFVQMKLHEHRTAPQTLILGMWVLCCPVIAFAETPAPAGENPQPAPTVSAPVPIVTATPETQNPAEPVPVFPTDAQVFSWFSAILGNDFAAAKSWLDQGMDVDVHLPSKPPKEFLDLITESRMLYYVKNDRGVTALMMAAGTGAGPAVDFLLEHGADRFKKTTRNRTHPLWLACKTGEVDVIRKLMPLDPAGDWTQYTVKVSLAEQKMRLFRNDELILESPISSGKKSTPTPTGRFVVTDKHREWKSTIYHVSMPHFVRLSCGEVGLHAGPLPGHPASHGCIRLPADKARELFKTLPIGALVVVEE